MSIVLLGTILFPSLARASSISCPNPPPFSPLSPIDNHNFTYPSIIKNSPTEWLMFSGGLTSQLPDSVRSNIPSSHFIYPLSQEEIWVSKSSDLLSWSTSRPSLTILPETPVSFKNNESYQMIYPKGFKTGCASLTSNSQCNVQINDPSAVVFNNNIYMYFTILENYRWYDGTLGTIVEGGPNNPSQQNIHSIGLAVSSDSGANWAFVDKVVLESETDSQGQPILGAWAPSAVVTSPTNVDIYFHDANGTKQYVAHLEGGSSLKRIDRLNQHDTIYRTNLDVIRNGPNYEAVYNDSSFNIVRTYFTSPTDFGIACETSLIVPADSTHTWPTPHQVIVNNKVHLFFWQFQSPGSIMHWVRDNYTSKVGDLNNDDKVDLFDFNLLVSKYGNPYTLVDFNNLVINYGK